MRRGIICVKHVSVLYLASRRGVAGRCASYSSGFRRSGPRCRRWPSRALGGCSSRVGAWQTQCSHEGARAAVARVGTGDVRRRPSAGGRLELAWRAALQTEAAWRCGSSWTDGSRPCPNESRSQRCVRVRRCRPTHRPLAACGSRLHAARSPARALRARRRPAPIVPRPCQVLARARCAMCNLTGVQSGNSSTGVKGRKMGGIARSIGLFYVVALGAGLVLLVVTILARRA